MLKQSVLNLKCRKIFKKCQSLYNNVLSAAFKTQTLFTGSIVRIVYCFIDLEMNKKSSNARKFYLEVLIEYLCDVCAQMIACTVMFGNTEIYITLMAQNAFSSTLQFRFPPCMTPTLFVFVYTFCRKCRRVHTNNTAVPVNE